MVVVLAAVVGMASTLFLAYSVVVPAGNDWRILERAALHLDSNPYESGTYVYTPLFTYLFAWTVLPLGLVVTMAAHLAALPLLRDRLLIGLTLATPAFWMTVALGNVFWFSVVLGVVSLRGSRWAMVASVIMFVLLPRPIMVPLVAWLVWKRPWLRLPALGIAAVAVAGNLVTGYTDEWLSIALAISGDYPWNDWNWGPTRLIGSAWLIFGVPLAAWLTYRGHIGWAGLAMSPYIVPPLLLVLLFELRGGHGHAASAPTVRRRTSPALVRG